MMAQGKLTKAHYWQEMRLMRQIEPTNYLDRDLISAIIKIWRRETHTFHLPVGEMAVTLEDVSFLWGLPINEYPIIGFADDNWEEDVLQAFDRLEWASFRRPPGT
jgi:Plant mobile domain